MTKLVNLEKNSFTLLEILISIILLSIIIIGFTRNFYYDSLDKEFILLNKIGNSFSTKNYNKNFSTSLKNLTIIKNDTIEEIILIKSIKYEDKSIKLIKYEL